MIDACQNCQWGPNGSKQCEYYHLPESMRENKSADTTAKIFELEHIISDLKGHLAWHKRRVVHESE